MVLQIGADARQMMHDVDTVAADAPPSPTPDSISKCGEPIAPADRINSRPAAT